MRPKAPAEHTKAERIRVGAPPSSLASGRRRLLGNFAHFSAKVERRMRVPRNPPERKKPPRRLLNLLASKFVASVLDVRARFGSSKRGSGARWSPRLAPKTFRHRPNQVRSASEKQS